LIPNATGCKIPELKKREYLKDRLKLLAMNCKNKNIGDLYGGVNEFKRGYHPRNNLVKEENGDLLAKTKIKLSP
jgi:hypothetical protein